MYLFGFPFFTLLGVLFNSSVTSEYKSKLLFHGWIAPTCLACECWRRCLMRPEETEGVSGRYHLPERESRDQQHLKQLNLLWLLHIQRGKI